MKTSIKCVCALLASQVFQLANATFIFSQSPIKQPTELSVPPLDHIEYPEDRPTWIVADQTFSFEDGRVIVVTDPCETIDSAMDLLKKLERVAVNGLRDEWMKRNGILDWRFGELTDAEIDSDLVSKQYTGELVQGGQVRHEIAVELRLTKAIISRWDDAIKNLRIKNRIANVVGGMVGAFVFFVLSSLLLNRHGLPFLGGS